MNALAKAQALVSVGLHVLPVHADKTPFTPRGVHDASNDPQVVADWWLSDYPDAPLVGVACGASGLLVVDIDRHPGGADGFEELASSGLAVPPTYNYATAGGGAHHVYTAPRDSRNSRPLPGVDVKAGGGYVVWHGDVPASADAFTPAPSWTLRPTAKAAPAKWTESVEVWIAGNPGEPDGELVHALESLPPFGQLAEPDLLGYAVKLVRAAEYAHGGAEAMRRLYALYASGEWDTPMYRARVERVIRRAIELHGAKCRADTLDLPVRIMLGDTPGDGVSFAPSTRATLADLMSMDFPPLQWVVPGLIPEGTTLLVGAPKAGKSWLALEIALACSTGTHAFGSRKVGAPRPVLYLDLESGERRLQSRVQAQGWSQFGALEYSMDKATAYAEAVAFLEQHRGERPLVVVDTLAGVMTDKAKDSTQYAHDYATVSRFQRLTREDPGAAVILVHHARKAESMDPMDMISGTNGLSGGVDTPIVLRRPNRFDSAGELHVMSRDFEGGEFAMLFDRLRWHIVGTLDDANADQARAHGRSNLGPVKQGILHVVESEPEREWTAAEIMAQYGGVSKSEVGKRLSELVASGEVVRLNRGTYAAKAA